jgi:hypothetical protein
MTIKTKDRFMFDKHTEIIPFKYENRRQGFLAKKDGVEFNITLNLMDTKLDDGEIVLKLWGDAETVNQTFKSHFKGGTPTMVGNNWALIVKMK